IKLDFSQVLQSQLQGLRKPLDQHSDHRPLTELADINDEDIKAFHAIAIYSIHDLERYTQTAAMVAEVSRKTGIADHRIRKWRQLPFLEILKPAFGPPGSTVLIEGGNFGSQLDPNAVILFQGQPATITNWSDSRLTVTMPMVTGSGVLFAVIGGQTTNTVMWEATTIDLVVRDLFVTPERPMAGKVIVFKVELMNQGKSASGAFEVQWVLDNQPQPAQPHGSLQPGQRSQESSTLLLVQNLTTGKHTIRFIADPNQRLADVNLANGTFTKEITVNALNQLTIGDFRKSSNLDPLRNLSLGPADALNLIFRGLLRRDSRTGELVSDIAQSWQTKIISTDGPVMLAPKRSLLRRNDEYSRGVLPRRPPFDDEVPLPIDKQWQQIVIFDLRDNIRFHDGAILTAEDVAFSYQVAQKDSFPWSKLLNSIVGIEVYSKTSLAFYLREQTQFEGLAPEIWTLGIVRRIAYESNPDGFGNQPIGSGPFRVERFVPGQEIALKAFPDYVQGTPRLEQLTITTTTDANQLTQQVMDGTVRAAILPYTESLYKQFKTNANWTAVPILEQQPALLQVQPATGFFERQPNQFDTNWNAHLWY
ncbi:MAG TPA: ABC transporter substrate-binding protein, partial [Coleofasciculaceae cyanobacterium]